MFRNFASHYVKQSLLKNRLYKVTIKYVTIKTKVILKTHHFQIIFLYFITYDLDIIYYIYMVEILVHTTVHLFLTLHSVM